MEPRSVLSDQAEPALPIQALFEIAGGLARVQQWVPLEAGGNAGAPRSIRLLATASYDVWLITWPSGSGIASHDHGGVHSVMQLVDGELLERFVEHPDERNPGVRRLTKGQSSLSRGSFAHSLENRSLDDATTIHVYSPPLVQTNFSEQDLSAQARQRHPAMTGSRAPVASSKDLARAIGSPLSLIKC
jgi:hypothetical protein